MSNLKQLVITLDVDTTKKYMDKASEMMRAEIEADCLPSGETIKVEIAPPFGNLVYIKRGGEWLELGEAEVDVIKGNPNSIR